MVLTAVIAVSAAGSAYYAFQTAKIASDQEARERRQEIREVVTLFTNLFEAYQELSVPEDANLERIEQSR